jgi:hypothetical protein
MYASMTSVGRYALRDEIESCKEGRRKLIPEWPKVDGRPRLDHSQRRRQELLLNLRESYVQLARDSLENSLRQYIVVHVNHPLTT